MDRPETGPHTIPSPELNPEEILDKGLASAPEQGKLPEHLYHANKLFFHATPLENISSVIKSGLFSTRDTDTLGRNFFYSLTFKNEYNDPGQNRGVLKFGPLKDKFSLTIWRGSVNIKQTKPHPGKRRFSPASIPMAEAPNDYYWNRIKGVNNVPGEKVRNVPATDFLASIEIDEYIISYFAGAKLGLMFNLVSAKKLEPLAEEFLRGMSTECELDLRLNNKYTLGTLVKDLISHIYHEVITEYSRQATATLEKEIAKLHPDHKKIQQIMEDLLFKRDNAPDKLSYRYLNMLISRSVKSLASANLRYLLPAEAPDFKNAPHISLRELGIDSQDIIGSQDAFKYFQASSRNKPTGNYFN